MNITEFSKHIFWSYKRDANLPDKLIIRQVIAHGELQDFKLLMKKFSSSAIHEAIDNWKKKDKYRKHINFIKKVILCDE
jgi:hypothetical protein